MTKDLRASQLQVNQIVPSGSSGTNARLVIYPVENQSTSNPNQGIIDPTKFNTSSIGTDVFLYVSGGKNKTGVANSQAITVFGGDVFISGNLNTSGSTQNVYWFSNVSGTIYQTGSIEFRTGSDGSGTPHAYITMPVVQNGTTLVDAEHWLIISGANTLVSGWGGTVKILAGDGGTDANSGGYGGDLIFEGGAGGASYVGAGSDGSSGGNINSYAGAGGDSGGYSSVGGGPGGSSGLYAGNGGWSTGTSGFSGNGGPGGNITIGSGGGGFNAASGSAGDGGLVYIVANNGGGSNVGYGGGGGSIQISAGAAGPGSQLKTFHSASTLANGGNITIQAGSPTSAYSYASGSAGTFYILGGTIKTNSVYTSGSSLQIGEGASAGSTIGSFGRVFINGSVLSSSTGFPGTDNFFFVSGTINGRNRVSGSVATFGGDVIISGNLYLSGSKRYAQYITVAGYLATVASSSNPQVAGHTVISQSEVNTNSIVLRGVLSSFTGSVTASLKLYNLTSGSYVEIGGSGVTTLSTTNTTPTQVQSVNLLSATNFGTGSNIYETQVYTSNTSVQVYHGSTMFVCT